MNKLTYVATLGLCEQLNTEVNALDMELQNKRDLSAIEARDLQTNRELRWEAYRALSLLSQTDLRYVEGLVEKYNDG